MKKYLYTLFLFLGVAVHYSAGKPQNGEYIVVLKDGQAIGRIQREHQVAVLKHIEGTGVYLIRQEGGDGQPSKKLQADPGLDAIEPNVAIDLADSEETLYLLDDTAETLYLLDTKAQTLLNGVDVPKIYAEQPALSIIEGDKARSISTGAAARVATIDTGVDFDHPALRLWLDPGADLVNGRSASELDGLRLSDSEETLYLLDGDGGEQPISRPSAFGHGTLVAGAIHLVAPDARIVPIKAFDFGGRTSMFTIVDAVYRAIELRADVINMSFSTGKYSPALRAATDVARAAGVTVVSSMGNEGHYSDSVFPAAYPGVFGVAATDLQDRLAPFSNYGKSVSISAPGVWIVSTVPGGGYGVAWGTSFSAPFVSGTAALLASFHSRGHSDGPLVAASAQPIGELNPGFEKWVGKGRVNARRALEQR